MANANQDTFVDQQPVMAALMQSSVTGIQPTGERSGKRIRRVLEDPASGQRTGDLCYASRGFSLHAARRVRADQRKKLEELCRYVLHPPLANNRLSIVSEQEVVLRLKSKWSDGTSMLVFTPKEIIARLAALVPPKGFNDIRYFGVLAPRHRWREQVVPEPPPLDSCDHDQKEERSDESSSKRSPKPQRRSRIPWPELRRRTFRSQVDQCDCGSRLKFVAFVTDPFQAARYLKHVGLPAVAPEISPARLPDQFDFEFA